MTYIILRDTFGRGLETIRNIDLEVIDEEQLDDYICNAADITLEDDGYETLSEYEERWDDGSNPMGDILVICEIVETIKGKDSRSYVRDVIVKRDEEKNTEEYKLYLQLKEKYEK